MEIEIRAFDRDLHHPLLMPLTQLLHTAYSPLAALGFRYDVGFY